MKEQSNQSHAVRKPERRDPPGKTARVKPAAGLSVSRIWHAGPIDLNSRNAVWKMNS
jgi:hypothetical protein